MKIKFKKNALMPSDLKEYGEENTKVYFAGETVDDVHDSYLERLRSANEIVDIVDQKTEDEEITGDEEVVEDDEVTEDEEVVEDDEVTEDEETVEAEPEIVKADKPDKKGKSNRKNAKSN